MTKECVGGRGIGESGREHENSRKKLKLKNKGGTADDERSGNSAITNGKMTEREKGNQ